MPRRELWRVSPKTDRALQETALAAVSEIHATRQRAHEAIKRECTAWARKKYGRSPQALVFAARLHGVAVWTLVSLRTFTLGPMLVTLRALQRHLAAVQVSDDDRREVAARLHRANIPARLLGQVLAAMNRGTRDPMRIKLDQLFSMHDGVATRFFDHRGRLPVKKLPFIPDLRAVLVTAFRHPETVDRRLGAHPQGLSVTAPDAYHLTAICLTAAFPTQFRPLTGEGVKQAIAYDRPSNAGRHTSAPATDASSPRSLVPALESAPRPTSAPSPCYVSMPLRFDASTRPSKAITRVGRKGQSEPLETPPGTGLRRHSRARNRGNSDRLLTRTRPETALSAACLLRLACRIVRGGAGADGRGHSIGSRDDAARAESCRIRRSSAACRTPT